MSTTVLRGVNIPLQQYHVADINLQNLDETQQEHEAMQYWLEKKERLLELLEEGIRSPKIVDYDRDQILKNIHAKYLCSNQ